MPIRTGAAMRSQTATTTRRVSRKEVASFSSDSAIGPSVIGRLARRSRRVPIRPVAVTAKVIGVPIIQSQGRYCTDVLIAATACEKGLGPGARALETRRDSAAITMGGSLRASDGTVELIARTGLTGPF